MATDKSTSAENLTIVLAGATGDLGGRIVRALRKRGTRVRALVRTESNPEKVAALRNAGVEIVEVDFNSFDALTKACDGASCVVSALSGLRDVLVITQTRLLDAAVEAGVPRFIPSDFAIDYTKLPKGTNRNLDIRMEFRERLENASIAATSILNGMFADLLTGQAPMVIFPLRHVVYWGSATQPLDFTTIEDTANYTAAAALDPSTPRFLRIAGDVLNAHELAEAASKATGKRFNLFRAGTLGTLDTLIKFTRAVSPQHDEVFPAWQGMQYMRNMFSGLPKLEPLDNDRYPDIRWTPVQEVLTSR